MEKSSPNTFSSFFSVLHRVEFFLHRIFNGISFEKFYCGCLSLFPSQLQFFIAESTVSTERKNPNPETDATRQTISNNRTDVRIRSPDVEMVMERLGLSCNPGNDKIRQEEILGAFDADEPNLKEVKETFLVFDVKRDGFIDAEELQRVLSQLGFDESSNFNACEMMNRAYDECGDERIDFNEFVKLMEIALC